LPDGRIFFLPKSGRKEAERVSTGMSVVRKIILFILFHSAIPKKKGSQMTHLINCLELLLKSCFGLINDLFVGSVDVAVLILKSLL
jgi:hypothetical protein